MSCQKGNRFSFQAKPHIELLLEIQFGSTSKQHIYTSMNKSLTPQSITTQQTFKLVSESIKENDFWLTRRCFPNEEMRPYVLLRVFGLRDKIQIACVETRKNVKENNC